MKEAFPKVAFINNNTAVTKPRRVQRKRAGPWYSDDSGIYNFLKKKKMVAQSATLNNSWHQKHLCWCKQIPMIK